LARADGLLLLVEELLIGLARSGALTRDADGWSVTQPLVPTVPVALVDSIERRLNLVTVAAQQAVSAAALLARLVDVEMVARTAGLDHHPTTHGRVRRTPFVKLFAGGDDKGAGRRHPREATAAS
jgi:hypothetical protein